MLNGSKEARNECLTSKIHCTTGVRLKTMMLNRRLNAIESGGLLDLSQIKGYLTDRLKPENVEKLVQKVKDKFVMSTIVNGDKNRHCAHICVVCDCLVIGMEEVMFIEKKQLINSSKWCVSAYEQYYDGVSLHEKLVGNII
jgi:hypothetical protein